MAGLDKMMDEAIDDLDRETPTDADAIWDEIQTMRESRAELEDKIRKIDDRIDQLFIAWRKVVR